MEIVKIESFFAFLDEHRLAFLPPFIIELEYIYWLGKRVPTVPNILPRNVDKLSRVYWPFFEVAS